MRDAWATALGRVPSVTAFGCRLVRLQLADTRLQALLLVADIGVAAIRAGCRLSNTAAADASRP